MTSRCCVSEKAKGATALESPQNLSLNIAEVRKALASLRKGWEEVQQDPRSKPLYLSSTLPLPSAQGTRLDDFALRFVLAHHQKRHSGAPSATS